MTLAQQKKEAKRAAVSSDTMLGLWLAEKGVTQCWLAGRVGVSQGAVSKWLRGGGMRRDAAVKVPNGVVMFSKQKLTVKGGCVSHDFINDARLSWAARGLFAYLVANPAARKSPASELAKVTQDAGKRTGRDGVYALIEELQREGYIDRVQIKGSDGKFERVEIRLLEKGLL